MFTTFSKYVRDKNKTTDSSSVIKNWCRLGGDHIRKGQAGSQGFDLSLIVGEGKDRLLMESKG